MDTIHHEHLASISQHDWYICCYQTNHAVLLEDARYAVVCRGDIDTNPVTFDSLAELYVWAGY